MGFHANGFVALVRKSNWTGLTGSFNFDITKAVKDHVQGLQQGKIRSISDYRFDNQEHRSFAEPGPLWIDIITIATIMVFTWFMLSQVDAIVLSGRALYSRQSIIVS